MPQNRLGIANDEYLPSDMDQNAYTRDAVTETVVHAKNDTHKPVVYTLPKNTKLESVQHLDSIQDTDAMQAAIAKAIANVMGIPYEVIAGGYSQNQVGNHGHQPFSVPPHTQHSFPFPPIHATGC